MVVLCVCLLMCYMCCRFPVGLCVVVVLFSVFSVFLVVCCVEVVVCSVLCACLCCNFVGSSGVVFFYVPCLMACCVFCVLWVLCVAQFLSGYILCVF